MFWIRITLMRIWMRILIFIWCGPGFLFHADPNLTVQPDADPDPDPSFLIKAQTLEKSSNWLIFQTFWLLIWKLMRIRFRINLITSMRIRMQIRIVILWGCGSGSTTQYRVLSSIRSWHWQPPFIFNWSEGVSLQDSHRFYEKDSLLLKFRLHYC